MIRINVADYCIELIDYRVLVERLVNRIEVFHRQELVGVAIGWCRNLAGGWEPYMLS